MRCPLVFFIMCVHGIDNIILVQGLWKRAILLNLKKLHVTPLRRSEAFKFQLDIRRRAAYAGFRNKI